MVRKLTHAACMFLGWCFVIIGIGSIVVNNHSDPRPLIASPEWWAATSTLPIAALFFIASALMTSPTSSQDQGEKK